MERAHHAFDDMTDAPGTGAPIVGAAGVLMNRKNTVLADVLCRLLSGEVLTGLDAVITSSTTRLAAGIHTLSEDYGWTIKRSDKVVGCKDGRTATVAAYHVLPSLIVAAERIGAVSWCAEVRKARAHLRTKAAEAKLRADRINAANSKHKRASSESQSDLFASHV